MSSGFFAFSHHLQQEGMRHSIFLHTHIAHSLLMPYAWHCGCSFYFVIPLGLCHEMSVVLYLLCVHSCWIVSRYEVCWLYHLFWLSVTLEMHCWWCMCVCVCERQTDRESQMQCFAADNHIIFLLHADERWQSPNFFSVYWIHSCAAIVHVHRYVTTVASLKFVLLAL